MSLSELLEYRLRHTGGIRFNNMLHCWIIGRFLDDLKHSSKLLPLSFVNNIAASRTHRTGIHILINSEAALTSHKITARCTFCFFGGVDMFKTNGGHSARHQVWLHLTCTLSCVLVWKLSKMDLYDCSIPSYRLKTLLELLETTHSTWSAKVMKKMIRYFRVGLSYLWLLLSWLSINRSDLLRFTFP